MSSSQKFFLCYCFWGKRMSCLLLYLKFYTTHSRSQLDMKGDLLNGLLLASSLGKGVNEGRNIPFEEVNTFDT